MTTRTLIATCQDDLDRDLPGFLAEPAERRELHLRGMTGPVDLRGVCNCWVEAMEGCGNHSPQCDATKVIPVHLVRVSGETGPNARPMHPQWVRDIRDQCAAAGVEFVFEERKEVAMKFCDFSRINRRRCESPSGFNHALKSWSLSDWMTATMGELGEAANVAKKLNRVRDGIPGNNQSEDELRAALRDEVADAFIYLDLLAQSEGFLIEDAVRDKFNRTSEKIGTDIKIA